MKVEREMKISIKTQLVLLPFMVVLVIVSVYLLSVTDRQLELTKVQATQMTVAQTNAVIEQSEIDRIQPKLLCSVFLKGKADVVAENRQGKSVFFVNHQAQIFGVTPDRQFYHVADGNQDYFLINGKNLDFSRCPAEGFTVYERGFFK